MVALATKLGRGQRRFLRNLFPGEDCLFSAEEMAVFRADASRVCGEPLAVVRPTDRAQIVELMRWAHAERVPIHIRARATNLVGACAPQPPGVVVSTLKLDRVLDIDTHDFVAVVEPGVVTGHLQDQVERLGLFYPPDPASFRFSTVGGNVATCAGGMRAVKYGVTREYVLGLEAVLPGGAIITPGGRCHKNVVGLDLVRLLVGSAGTLAFLDRITLKLLPKPEASASVLCGFASMAQAMDAAVGVFQAGMLPTALEFFDHNALGCVAMVADAPWTDDVQAALLFKLDGGEASLQAELDRLVAVARESRPMLLETGQGADEERFWDLRRFVSPACYQFGPDKFADDVTVPRGKVAQALEAFHALARQLGVTLVCLQDAALALGGSLSGEHGIGVTKLATLDKQLSAVERRLLRDIKTVFDPRGIMNPGKAY